MRWFIAILILSGCGKGLTGPSVNHGVFEPFFQEFETASLEHGRDTTGDDALVIEFGNSADEAGTCYSGFDGRHIEINEQIWNDYDDTYRKLLIYHELGHCLLNRVHDQKLRENRYPESIMNPNIVSITEIWDTDSEYYLNELFTSDQYK